MTDAAQQAKEALTQLAQDAHQQADDQANPAQKRFKAHLARDKYQEAISLLEEATKLLQPQG